jgi:SAM-dependent methyltransferase
VQSHDLPVNWKNRRQWPGDFGALRVFVVDEYDIFVSNLSSKLEKHKEVPMQSTPPGQPSPFDDGEFYDLICQDLDYGIDFYVGLAREAKGPVLEIACGTGRILLPVLQAGVDADGLDLFEPMLDRARRKAAGLGLSPDLRRGDMADFQMPRRYGLVMITFNAFCHMLTTEDQLRCLGCIRRHLLPGGLLAFDGSFPGVEWIGAPQDQRELEGQTKHPLTGQTIRFYDTRNFDRVAQIQRSRNEVELDEPDGTTRIIHRSEFFVRWTYKAEMELLLRSAGFTRYEVCGGFDRRPLTQETDQMVVLAWADE